MSGLAHLLLAIATVVVAARAMGAAFRWVGQPPVLGEVVAGIALGPTLLGRVSPDAFAFVFPSSVMPPLSSLGQLGVLVFMFLVGVKLDPAPIREKTGATLAISAASVFVPLVLGAGLGVYLHPRVSVPSVPMPVFALFLGVAMAVTAFPVLARILAERGLERTRLGTLALACAAADDLLAWCLLALAVAIARARITGAFVTLALALGYLAAMFGVARPLVRRFADANADGRFPDGGVALVMVALLLSALATEAIGVHAVFGAFLLGALVPHDSKLAVALVDRLESLVVIVLLPAFFASTGLHTQLGLIGGTTNAALTALIIVVACTGKVCGTGLAAYAAGLGARGAASLGVLMNTRGLMEIVVLEVGRELGIVSPALFAMMVVMALVTTFATTPLLVALAPKSAA